MSRSLPARAAFCGLLGGGCSFGSFQTAHTQAPATVSVTAGATNVMNAIDDQAGRDLSTNVGGQLGVRVGVADRVDVGLGSFFQTGGRADAKINVLDPRGRVAIAPRLGVGYQWAHQIYMLEGGAIASVRAQEWLEPYLGLSFANHWIESYEALEPLPQNAVGKSGSGDGLLQLSLGVELAASRYFAVLAEYGHWFVLNDDPGDHFRFVATNILGIAVRVGRVQ